MNVRVCPKCGTHNSESEWSCTECGETLSLKTLMDTSTNQLGHHDQVGGAKFEASQQDIDSTKQTVSKGAIVFALSLLLVCGLLWCFSSLMLTPPQFGPCASGGANYDSYLALVKYWSLHLVLGYFVVVTRVFVGTQSRDKGTVLFGHFLTLAIVAWIIVVIYIWNQIFSRLCV